MSVSEVAARGARQLRFAVERLGALRADQPPPASAWPPPAERPLPAPMVAIRRTTSRRPIASSAAASTFSARASCSGRRALECRSQNSHRSTAPFGKTLNYRDTHLVGDINTSGAQPPPGGRNARSGLCANSDRRYSIICAGCSRAGFGSAHIRSGPTGAAPSSSVYASSTGSSRIASPAALPRFSSRAAKGNGLPRSGCCR